MLIIELNKITLISVSKVCNFAFLKSAFFFALFMFIISMWCLCFIVIRKPAHHFHYHHHRPCQKIYILREWDYRFVLRYTDTFPRNYSITYQLITVWRTRCTQKLNSSRERMLKRVSRWVGIEGWVSRNGCRGLVVDERLWRRVLEVTHCWRCGRPARAAAGPGWWRHLCPFRTSGCRGRRNPAQRTPARWRRQTPATSGWASVRSEVMQSFHH